MDLENFHSKPENIKSPIEIKETKEAVTPLPVESQKSAESIELQEKEKVQKEKVRLARIEELREELGAVSPISAETEEKDVKKEGELKEDREKLSYSFRQISNTVDELSSTIIRNKFPKVRFNSEQINALALGEAIDQTVISRQLDDLSASINKITFPDDRRDRMALEPLNFRAVITQMEELNAKLSLLKQTFEKVKSQDFKDISQGINKISKKIASKIESFTSALIALQRIRER